MALRSNPSNLAPFNGGTVTNNTNFPNGINVYSELIATNNDSIKYYKLARVRFISTLDNPNGTFERALFNIKLYHTGNNLKIGNIKGYFYNASNKRNLHSTSFLMCINNSGSTGFSAGDILYFPLDSGSDANDYIVDIYLKVTNWAKVYQNTESATFENGCTLTIKPDGSTLISSLPVAGTTTIIDGITYTYGSSVNGVITSDLNSQTATIDNAIPKFSGTAGQLVGSQKLSINASDQLVSTVTSGAGSPFIVGSTTRVDNLNVSLLNGIADTGFLRTSFSNALENNIGIIAKETGGTVRTIIQLDSTNLVNVAHPNLQTYLRGTAIYIANAIQLQAKDTGGTSRNLVSMNASNVIQVGATTNATTINSTPTGLMHNNGTTTLNIVTEVTGTAAPAVTPNFAGQIYVDTTNKKSYSATGTTNSADWLPLVSNLDSIMQTARVATTANITLSGLQTIDGYTTVAGDRVLVKDQSTGSQNGLYVAASGSWSRTTDIIVSHSIFNVERGTLNRDTIFMVTTDAPITIGTTALTIVPFGKPISVISLSGTAAPAVTPAFLGQQFVDTTNKKVYVATGTTNSSDWTILN